MSKFQVTCPCGCNNTFEVEAPAKSATPKEGSKTHAVWDLCNRLTQEGGKRASRKQVLEVATQAGMNPYTVQTQYQRWFKSNYPNGDKAVETQPQA